MIALRDDLAPGHVERITELAREGFYDGVVFHRVIPGFMAQGGDPTGTGMGGSKKPDLKAEFNKEPHVRGTCSMARSQNPNSANSQFFICFEDARFLDNQYTAWGNVTSGMEYVDALPKGEPPRPASHSIDSRLVMSPISGPASSSTIAASADPLCPPKVRIAPDRIAAGSVVAWPSASTPQSSGTDLPARR